MKPSKKIVLRRETVRELVVPHDELKLAAGGHTGSAASNCINCASYGRPCEEK